jgi:hypothetical protein
MKTVLMISAAVLLLLIACHVQLRIPAFTKGEKTIATARLLLIAVGTGVGLANAAFASEILQKGLMFAIGFGIVHVPAAFILFIKSQRGAGKS